MECFQYTKHCSVKIRAPLQCKFPGQRTKLEGKLKGGPGKVWSRTFYHKILCPRAFWVLYIFGFLFCFQKVLFVPRLFVGAEYHELDLPPFFLLLLFLIVKPCMAMEERGRNNSWISLAKSFLTPWIICLASRCGCRVTGCCFMCIPCQLYQPYVGLLAFLPLVNAADGSALLMNWTSSLLVFGRMWLGCQSNLRSPCSFFCKGFGNSDPSLVLWGKSR